MELPETIDVILGIPWLKENNPVENEPRARRAGQATSADEKEKRDKYEVECRAKNYDFVPFAVDEFGKIADSGQHFLEQLAARTAATRTGDFREGTDEAQRRAHWLRIWRARIAWAVHRGIELSLERRMQRSGDVAVGH